MTLLSCLHLKCKKNINNISVILHSKSIASINYVLDNDCNIQYENPDKEDAVWFMTLMRPTLCVDRQIYERIV